MRASVNVEMPSVGATSEWPHKRVQGWLGSVMRMPQTVTLCGGRVEDEHVDVALLDCVRLIRHVCSVPQWAQLDVQLSD